MKYTEGKWEARLSFDERKWLVCAGQGVGSLIADCGEVTRETAAANTRLIAAAPDLLAALKKAESHLDYCGYGDSWERECAEKLPDIIGQAIAKAEGKQ